MFVSAIKATYAFFVDTIQTLLLAASIFLVVYVFLFRPFQVSGESMDPTFRNREYVLTNLIGLRLSQPKRGDVIVFRAPNDRDKDFIKRVIGEPGDAVQVISGAVYVNNQRLDESLYLSPTMITTGGAFLKEGQSITVPDNQYFVMGDNRSASSDSREWGFLQRDDVIGTSFYVYWPVTNMRGITNPFSH